MSLSIRPYVINPTLTACRVSSPGNLVGSYFNGQTNNGVGATLTATTAAALVVDLVTLNVGDRVLLAFQTAAEQNGIYTVTNPGSASISWVLTRAQDFQNIEQLQEGQYVSIAAGTLNGGAIYTLVEPLPIQFGISSIIFNASTNPVTTTLGTAATKNASNNTLPTVSSVNGATVAGNFLKAADTAGTVQDGGAALHTILTLAIPGGSTSYLIPVTDMTAASVAVATPDFVTNDSYITQCHTSAGALTLTFNIDPGPSTVNVFWSTLAF